MEGVRSSRVDERTASVSSQEGFLPRAGKDARPRQPGGQGAETLARPQGKPVLWDPWGPALFVSLVIDGIGGSPGWTAPGTHQEAAESEPGARRQPHGQPGCAQRPARPPYPPSERVGHHPSRRCSRHVCQDGGNEGAHVGASRSGRVRSAVWGPRSLFPSVVGEGLGQVLLPPPAVAPMCLSGSKRPPFLL